MHLLQQFVLNFIFIIISSRFHITIMLILSYNICNRVREFSSKKSPHTIPFRRSIACQAVYICTESSRFKKLHSLSQQASDDTGQNIAGTAFRHTAVSATIDTGPHTIRNNAAGAFQNTYQPILSGKILCCGQ